MQSAQAALANLQASVDASTGDTQQRTAEWEGLAQQLREVEGERGDLAEQVEHLRERCRGLEANIK